MAISEGAVQEQRVSVRGLGNQLEVGDLVFIRIGALPFRKVSEATASWTNHVGIVLDVAGDEPVVGESRVPFSGATRLSRFVARSQARRVAVARLRGGLTAEQCRRVAAAAKTRAGVLYDSGFDLQSRRQFCSRYVREVLTDATGTTVGDVESFSSLLDRNPHADLLFWRIWYFGRIPWQRRTVTPASLLASAELRTLFDGTLKR
jgi:hypothetical protein